MITVQRLRFFRFLAMPLLLVAVPLRTQAQAESGPKPASLARLGSLLTNLESSTSRDLSSSDASHADFRDLVKEDPAILAALADSLPRSEKAWTAAILADTVSEAGYRRAVPALLQRLSGGISIVFANFHHTGYDPMIAFPNALRTLAGPAEVHFLVAALRERNMGLRRNLMMLLAEIDTPEAIAGIRDFLTTGDRAPSKIKIKLYSSSRDREDPELTPDPEEQEIIAALARDIQAFGAFPKSKSASLSHGWKASGKSDEELLAENERHYSLTTGYEGYAVIMRHYHGMWIVTMLEERWIS